MPPSQLGYLAFRGGEPDVTRRGLRIVAVLSAIYGLLVGAGAVNALPIQEGLEDAPALPTTFVDTSLVASRDGTFRWGRGRTCRRP